MTDYEKILIVDDYPDILEGLSYVLKDHYEVTTAGNLTEAKKEVSTTVFDVICSDYAMQVKKVICTIFLLHDIKIKAVM